MTTGRKFLIGMSAVVGAASAANAFNLPLNEDMVFDFIDRTSAFNGPNSGVPSGAVGTPKGVGTPINVGDRDQSIFGVNSIHLNSNPPPNNPPSAGPIIGGLNLGSGPGTNQLTGTLTGLVVTQIEVFPGPNGVFGDVNTPGIPGTGDDLTFIGMGPDPTLLTRAPGDVIGGPGSNTWADLDGDAPAGSGAIVELWLDEDSDAGATAWGPEFIAGAAGPSGFTTGTVPLGDPSLSDHLEYIAASGTADLQDGTLYLTGVATPQDQDNDIDTFFGISGGLGDAAASHSIMDTDSLGPIPFAPVPNTARGSIYASLGSNLETVFIQSVESSNLRGDFQFYGNFIGGSNIDFMARGLYDNPGLGLFGRDLLFIGQNNVDDPFDGIVNEFQGWQLDSTDPVGFGTRPLEVPEPLSASMSIIALSGLCGYIRRR